MGRPRQGAILAEKAINGLAGVEEGKNCSDTKESIVAQLEVEVEERCRNLREDIASFCMELTNWFKQEKLKLPKAMRRIPLKQFIEDYGESASQILLAISRDPVSGPGVQPQTAVKAEKSAAIQHLRDNSISVVSKHETQLIPAQTPSKGFIRNPSSLVMETPGRIAKNGEVMFSARGSPILSLPQTPGHAVLRAEKGAKPQVAVELPEVGLVDMATDVAHLTVDLKKAAVGRLQQMQDEIARLMSQLQPS